MREVLNKRIADETDTVNKVCRPINLRDEYNQKLEAWKHQWAEHNKTRNALWEWLDLLTGAEVYKQGIEAKQRQFDLLKDLSHLVEGRGKESDARRDTLVELKDKAEAVLAKARKEVEATLKKAGMGPENEKASLGGYAEAGQRTFAWKVEQAAPVKQAHDRLDNINRELDDHRYIPSQIKADLEVIRGLQKALWCELTATAWAPAPGKPAGPLTPAQINKG